MKTVKLKKASLSALILWVLGVSAFVGSYYFQLMDNADEQANWFLTIALIPAIVLGVYIYNNNGKRTNGLPLAGYMFFLTMLMDALITVPLFLFQLEAIISASLQILGFGY